MEHLLQEEGRTRPTVAGRPQPVTACRAIRRLRPGWNGMRGPTRRR